MGLNASMIENVIKDQQAAVIEYSWWSPNLIVWTAEWKSLNQMRVDAVRCMRTGDNTNAVAS